MQNFSRLRKFVMLGLAAGLMGLAMPAQAEIFLQRSQDGAKSGTGSAPIFLNRNPVGGTQSGGTSIYIPSEQKTLKAMTPEERRARAQENYKTNTEAESGKTYSIDEYNRRMIAQRQKAANAANNPYNRSGTGNNSSYDNLSRSGYGVATNDRYVVDPGTGRMMKQSEVEALEKKRAEYLKNNRFASAKQRSPSEETFFLENGYYPDDANEPAGDKGIRNSFGTKLDYTPPARRDKYGQLANRYQNFTNNNGSDR